MFQRNRTLYCPVCKAKLGTYSSISMVIVDCPDEDCKVQWCFKPGEENPKALKYPGMKTPKKCNCPSCSK